jgi:SH3-like domain-containing protein
VFTRKNMPLEIYAEYENWRRVRDIDGAGGWVHYSMLSGVRSAIVTTDMHPLLSRPDRSSALRARIEHNVIVSIDECTLDWCRARSGQFKGWLPKDALWGVYPNELRD